MPAHFETFQPIDLELIRPGLVIPNNDLSDLSRKAFAYPGESVMMPFPVDGNLLFVECAKNDRFSILAKIPLIPEDDKFSDELEAEPDTIILDPEVINRRYYQERVLVEQIDDQGEAFIARKFDSLLVGQIIVRHSATMCRDYRPRSLQPLHRRHLEAYDPQLQELLDHPHRN